MIYTIGKKELYEQYFKDYGEELAKAINGSVWKNPLDVVLYKVQRPGYEIYGVLADWETQTIETENSWNALLVNSKLVKLDE